MSIYEMKLDPSVDKYARDERYNWCMENCQLGAWYLDRDTFVFLAKYDAIMFKLQWGEARQIEDEDMNRELQHSEHCR